MLPMIWRKGTSNEHVWSLSHLCYFSQQYGGYFYAACVLRWSRVAVRCLLGDSCTREWSLPRSLGDYETERMAAVGTVYVCRCTGDKKTWGIVTREQIWMLDSLHNPKHPSSAQKCAGHQQANVERHGPPLPLPAPT